MSASSRHDDPVLLERRSDAGMVAWVTLNRPLVFNAFEEETLGALWDVLRTLARDDGVRAVVLTGAGKAFCAGGNLRALTDAFPDRPGDGLYRLAAVFHQCVLELRQMPKPVVAAINGPAAGGGFSMALACDLRLMASSAFLQQTYTSNGLSIDGGGTFTLPRLVGMARALEIALLDERLSADRALALGLVHRVVEDTALEDEALNLAGALALKATATLGRVKALLNECFDSPLPLQLERERAALSESANSPEGLEGLQAFLEKRAPDFLDPDNS